MAELDHLFEQLAEQIHSEAGLEGKTVVITGKLRNYTRAQIQAAIHARGGRSPNSVTKDTVALCVGDKPGSTKVNRAIKLGLPIINEGQLMKMLEA